MRVSIMGDCTAGRSVASRRSRGRSAPEFPAAIEHSWLKQEHQGRDIGKIAC